MLRCRLPEVVQNSRSVQRFGMNALQENRQENRQKHARASALCLKFSHHNTILGGDLTYRLEHSIDIADLSSS